jgi:hypothetical protein
MRARAWFAALVAWATLSALATGDRVRAPSNKIEALWNNRLVDRSYECHKGAPTVCLI